MSLVYNDTTNKAGIIQQIERYLGMNDGDISGNSLLLAQFTADINIALDKFLAIAIPASGKWQFDDSSHSKYPIITTDIVSGQKDYSFTTDQQGNLILDIYKVLISDSNGNFRDIQAVDVEGDLYGDDLTFYNGVSNPGVPYRYDKLANGIFLDPVPNYNYVGGMKIYINREANYFLVSDTTKKPGIVGLFHDYLVIVPAHKYAFINSLPIAGGVMRNGARTGLSGDIYDMEKDIEAYYSRRGRDERPGLRVRNPYWIPPSGRLY